MFCFWYSWWKVQEILTDTKALNQQWLNYPCDLVCFLQGINATVEALVNDTVAEICLTRYVGGESSDIGIALDTGDRQMQEHSDVIDMSKHTCIGGIVSMLDSAHVPPSNSACSQYHKVTCLLLHSSVELHIP